MVRDPDDFEPNPPLPGFTQLQTDFWTFVYQWFVVGGLLQGLGLQTPSLSEAQAIAQRRGDETIKTYFRSPHLATFASMRRAWARSVVDNRVDRAAVQQVLQRWTELSLVMTGQGFFLNLFGGDGPALDMRFVDVDALTDDEIIRRLESSNSILTFRQQAAALRSLIEDSKEPEPAEDGATNPL